MKTPIALAVTAIAALILAGCGEQKSADAPKTNDMTGQMPMGEGMMKDGMMENDTAGVAGMAMSSGVVTAIDRENGAITIDHQPIPEAGWPAMTMAFKAGDPQMLDQVRVGDRVSFELALEGGGGRLTAIRLQ